MFTFFSLIIFFGVLFVLGWQLSRFILREKRIEVLLPLGAVLGIGFYIFFLNLFSYLINITISFYLVCLFFALISYFLYRLSRKREKPEWGISKSWRIVLLVTLLSLAVFAGMNKVWGPQSGELGYGHLTLVATVAEGNFPIMAVFAPEFPAQQHYGYHLFTAAITKITHLPVWFSFDLFRSIFAVLTFLLGFLLIKYFCRSNFKAWLASLVMIFGGNLNLIYGLQGLSSGNFRFLNDMIFGKALRGGFITHYIHYSDWVVLGFALTIAIIYLYFRAINDQKNWLKISFAAGIMFALLALSAELFFGGLAAVLISYPFIYAILRRDRKSGKFYLKSSLIILFLGLTIAVFQGGILTLTIQQNFFSSALPSTHYLSINPEYLIKGLFYADENVLIPFSSKTFFLAWGWMILFIIPVAIYVLKRYFQLGLFLFLLISASFFIPLILTAGESQGNFMRTNFLTALFWNLIFGLFIARLFLFFQKKWQRLLMIILISGVVFQGLSYAVLFSTFLDRKGEPIEKANSAELEVFNWIKKNTTVKDYFLTFPKELSGLYYDGKFTIYTGRISPDYWYLVKKINLLKMENEGILDAERALYVKILEECDPTALDVLKYRYLYVNENWPRGLEEKCLAGNDLKLVFQSGDNKIYKNDINQSILQ